MIRSDGQDKVERKTMGHYNKTIGRLTVEVNVEGARDHSYGHGCSVSCIAGWNDSCPKVTHTMSVEELRDLRYLLDRAIAEAEREY